MRLLASTLLTCFFVIAIPTLGAAECIPTDDPCAPKKTLNSWDTSALIGFNLSRGNADTTLLTSGLKAAFDDGSNLFDISTEYGYGQDDARNDPLTGDTSRNDFRFAAKYDRLIRERLYSGLGMRYLYDEIADVDYRLNIDPSLGFFLLRDNSFKFRVEAGPSYVFEKLGGEEDDYLAPRLADRFEWAISCTSKFFQQAEILFDASDSDNYLVNAELGIEAAINSALALVVTVRETYDNVPAAGRKKDDLGVITSLKVLL